MSGALIAATVRDACAGAAGREDSGEGGLRVDDVLAALDRSLAAEVEKLRTPHGARRMLDFPDRRGPNRARRAAARAAAEPLPAGGLSAAREEEWT